MTPLFGAAECRDQFKLGRPGLRLRKQSKWFQNGSMNITVKNIPDSIYRVMKREAKRKRRSLNAEIIQALETEASEAERRRQLCNLRKQLDRFAASLPPLDESVPLIREDRER
jgi:plasmid stability protein